MVNDHGCYSIICIFRYLLYDFSEPLRTLGALSGRSAIHDTPPRCFFQSPDYNQGPAQLPLPGGLKSA